MSPLIVVILSDAPADAALPAIVPLIVTGIASWETGKPKSLSIEPLVVCASTFK